MRFGNEKPTLLIWLAWMSGSVVLGLFAGIAWGNASVVIWEWLS